LLNTERNRKKKTMKATLLTIKNRSAVGIWGEERKESNIPPGCGQIKVIFNSNTIKYTACRINVFVFY
jgi:hypothetical protein